MKHKKITGKNKVTTRIQSASEGYYVVSVTDPYGHILGFLDGPLIIIIIIIFNK
jgi:hypothetical protein